MSHNQLKSLCHAKQLNRYLTDNGYKPLPNKSGSHLIYTNGIKSVSIPMHNGLKSVISIGVVRSISKIVEG